jgi:hypothetical protein
VGAVEKSAIIDGRSIVPGDVVLGLASSGAHSNGYSLVRKILERARPDLAADFHGRPLADVQALAVMAASLSRFAMEHPEIAALDINPVMAQHSGALAVDARIQIDDEGYTDHAAID